MTGPSLGEGLEGRSVIVTGAAGGIGGACARAMADCGARVIAVDLPGDRLTGCVETLGGRRDHLALPLDLASPPAIEAAIGELAGASPWALIHAAAYLRREPIEDVTEESWDAQHDVNLKGSFFLNRAVGRVLVAGGRGGRIVNFSSVAWQTGPILDSDAYVASKGGIVSLSRGFARRLGPHGITVNVIAPGQISTPMQTGGNNEATMAATSAACPLGRMGTPEEVAAVAVFLASSHASFVSGATLNVSGALLMY
jgi:NAD(P)-dependent dehydrogenase (short-subunit alcohol dehydrogenase family)